MCLFWLTLVFEDCFTNSWSRLCISCPIITYFLVKPSHLMMILLLCVFSVSPHPPVPPPLALWPLRLRRHSGAWPSRALGLEASPAASRALASSHRQEVRLQRLHSFLLSSQLGWRNFSVKCLLSWAPQPSVILFLWKMGYQWRFFFFKFSSFYHFNCCLYIFCFITGFSGNAFGSPNPWVCLIVSPSTNKRISVYLQKVWPVVLKKKN